MRRQGMDQQNASLNLLHSWLAIEKNQETNSQRRCRERSHSVPEGARAPVRRSLSGDPRPGACAGGPRGLTGSFMVPTTIQLQGLP